MKHAPFCQRPNYCQQLSCQQLRTLASSQSRAGHYNLATLWLFRKLWLQSGKGHDYLAYLLFRRALGYPLSANKANILQRFIALWPRRIWHKLYGHRLRQCRNLLAEHQHDSGGAVTTAAVPRRYQRQVRHWRSEQHRWHTQFSQYLQQAGSVVLVGNSPTLNGSLLGTAIDAADIVIRFNQFHSEHTQYCDSGRKCNVWVMAPDFRGQAPSAVQWCLVSGPDMVWQQQRWPQCCTRPDMQLLSIGLVHWRKLVRQLAAPPSAGLLTAQYIASILGYSVLHNNSRQNEAQPKSVLQLAGFGHTTASGQYHYAAPAHQAVSRHNWLAEHQLLQQWRQLHNDRTEQNSGP